MSDNSTAPHDVGRASSPAAEQVSRDLRTGTGDALRRRRRVGAMALSAMGSMGVVVAYQMGLLRHLPEPPRPVFDADDVDASGEAYQNLKTPDAALGLVSYATTLVLAGMVPPGGRRRSRGSRWRWLPRSASTPSPASTPPPSRPPSTGSSARGAWPPRH
ncbi:MAG: hypothetical protein ACR2MO_02945 [Acidimicrobiales bacterium]